MNVTSLALWLEANWPAQSRQEVLNWPALAVESLADECQLFERLECARQGLTADVDRLFAGLRLEELSQELAKWLEINRRSSAVVVLS